MSQITLKGKPVQTNGELPAIGTQAPDFVLTKTDLADVTLKDFSGKKVVLNIFPSVDTPVCAISVRKFNAEISKIDNAVAICASLDLPFAHARFCGAEGLKNVISVSELRNRSFGDRYGMRMVDGPLKGLLARAVVVIDENGRVIYTQLVPEISEEPDYQGALEALRS
ncbi:MAG: thiol peroxidase [Proteobacteria bacterium]|nr:thiol peroxidase [Pseudomonadota bacterium]